MDVRLYEIFFFNISDEFSLFNKYFFTDQHAMEPDEHFPEQNQDEILIIKEFWKNYKLK